MPDQQLKERFYSLLKASKSFQLLSAEEQANLLKIYETASDGQITAAIEALKKDEEDRRLLEEKMKQNMDRQIQLALKIKELLKEINLEERKANERQDTRESDKAAEELLGQIADADNEPGKKRKKFLGMF